jgi:hypothetical protein
MRYSLHEIDAHHIVATTVAADRDEELEWFSEKLRLMLTFEGDPVAAEYLLDEWHESLPYMADIPKPTIPVFVVRVAAHPQAKLAKCMALITSQSAQSGAAERGAICKSNSKTSNDDEREIIRDGGPLGC